MTVIEVMQKLADKHGLEYDGASRSLWEMQQDLRQLFELETDILYKLFTDASLASDNMLDYDILSNLRNRCERILKERQLNLKHEPVQTEQLDLGMSKAEKVAVVFGGEIINE